MPPAEEKKTRSALVQQLLDPVAREAEHVIDTYIQELERTLEAHASRFVVKMARLFALSMVSFVLLGVGAVLLTASLTEFLDLFLPFWATLGVLGVVVLAAAGGFMFLARRTVGRQRKSV